MKGRLIRNRDDFAAVAGRVGPNRDVDDWHAAKRLDTAHDAIQIIQIVRRVVVGNRWRELGSLSAGSDTTEHESARGVRCDLGGAKEVFWRTPCLRKSDDDSGKWLPW